MYPVLSEGDSWVWYAHVIEDTLDNPDQLILGPAIGGLRDPDPEEELGNVHIPDGYHLYQTGISHFYKVYSEREPTEFDEPPGVGFTQLSRDGSYIFHKTHRVREFYITDHVPYHPERILRHQDGSNDPSELFPASVVKQPFVLVFPSDYRSYRKFYFPTYDFSLSWTTFDPWREKVHQDAVRNLYGSLARRRRVELGIILGELKETLGLLGDTIIELLELYRAVKRGNLKAAYRVLRHRGTKNLPTRIPKRSAVNKERVAAGLPVLSRSKFAASQWLELQFGWLPMIQDIYSIIEYVKGLISSPSASPWLSFKGIGEGKRVTRSTLSHGLDTEKWECDVESTETYHVSLCGSFSVEGGFFDILNSIGLDNPAYIAWNLLPLSFVIDWIVPVGPWIESFTALAGLNPIEFTPSIRMTKVEVLSNFRHTYPYNPEYNEVFQGKQVIVSNEFARLPGVLSEIPPFPPRISGEAFTRGWTLITAAALIRQFV